jgi:O-antigen/teichoic acid export membrane protein
MRLFRNAASILASDVVNRGSTFLLYILVGRYLGQRAFGQLSLALALFYVFQVVAGAGLKVYVTRQVAKDEAKTDECLVLGSVVAAVFGLASILATLVFVEVMAYPVDTVRVILLLNAALLPFALSAVCEGVFQGREQMHYIVQATFPANLLKVGVVFALLTTGHGLEAAVAVVLGAYVVVLLIEWSLLLRHVTTPRLEFSLGRSIVMGREASTFLGVDALVAVMASINLVLLSKLQDERAVATYSAAAQLIVPAALVYQNAVLSIFPVMSRSVETALPDVRRMAERVGKLLLVIGWFVVVVLVMFAAPILSLVYGPGFRAAAEPLRIMAWSLLLIGLTATFGQMLYALGRERLNLRLVAINTVVTVIVSLVAVAQWGVIGAALAFLTTRLLDFALHYVAISKFIPRFDLTVTFLAPALPAVCMALVLATMAPDSRMIALLSGAAAYAVVFLLANRSAGNLARLKARYAGSRNSESRS